MGVQLGIGLGFVGIGLVLALLVWRRLRADERRRWHEHRSRHEETNPQRSLAERRW